MMNLHFFITIFLICTPLISCQQKNKNSTISKEKDKTPTTANKRNVTSEFKDYWYAGTAEITSYRLTQERYGELREGTGVTIFVTEDFLPEEQVKADTYSEENMSVLKLNTTKKFVTGIYPYSIMTSSFNPIATQDHATKVTNSVQEWCGQTFMQLNNREQFEITGHSYFASEGDIDLTLDKSWLEDELWNVIRINPEELPTGTVSVIPSFEYLRLRHKETKAYKGYATLMQRDSLTSYELNYPGLERTLTIHFNTSFPFEIEKWEERIGINPQDTIKLKTTAIKMKRLKKPYWQLNRNSDRTLRDTLQLN